MYYKLYRRRQYIFLVAFLVVLFFYFYTSSGGKPYSQNIQVKTGDSFRRARINAETYQVPEPCSGCPGENGRAVYLSVN